VEPTSSTTSVDDIMSSVCRRLMRSDFGDGRRLGTVEGSAVAGNEQGAECCRRWCISAPMLFPALMSFARRRESGPLRRLSSAGPRPDGGGSSSVSSRPRADVALTRQHRCHALAKEFATRSSSFHWVHEETLPNGWQVFTNTLLLVCTPLTQVSQDFATCWLRLPN
jgi:hypothetical protein